MEASTRFYCFTLSWGISALAIVSAIIVFWAVDLTPLQDQFVNYIRALGIIAMSLLSVVLSLILWYLSWYKLIK